MGALGSRPFKRYKAVNTTSSLSHLYKLEKRMSRAQLKATDLFGWNVNEKIFRNLLQKYIEELGNKDARDRFGKDPVSAVGAWVDEKGFINFRTWKVGQILLAKLPVLDKIEALMQCFSARGTEWNRIKISAHLLQTATKAILDALGVIFGCFKKISQTKVTQEAKDLVGTEFFIHGEDTLVTVNRVCEWTLQNFPWFLDIGCSDRKRVLKEMAKIRRRVEEEELPVLRQPITPKKKCSIVRPYRRLCRHPKMYFARKVETIEEFLRNPSSFIAESLKYQAAFKNPNYNIASIHELKKMFDNVACTQKEGAATITVQKFTRFYRGSSGFLETMDRVFGSFGDKKEELTLEDFVLRLFQKSTIKYEKAHISAVIKPIPKPTIPIVLDLSLLYEIVCEVSYEVNAPALKADDQAMKPKMSVLVACMARIKNLTHLVMRWSRAKRQNLTKRVTFLEMVGKIFPKLTTLDFDRLQSWRQGPRALDARTLRGAKKIWVLDLSFTKYGGTARVKSVQTRLGVKADLIEAITRNDPLLKHSKPTEFSEVGWEEFRRLYEWIWHLGFRPDPKNSVIETKELFEF